MKFLDKLSERSIAIGLFVFIVIVIVVGRLVWAHYVFDDLTCAYTTCVKVKS